MFGSSFNHNKLKVNLKLLVNRYKLLEKKKTELALKEHKEIAEYIKSFKYDRARIRVEHIIREDFFVEALEIVEMYADILLARLGLMTVSKSLDESLKKPISSLLWASVRLQGTSDELKIIKAQLSAYYGKEYALSCQSNEVGTVCERLMRKLDLSPPPRKLVEQYMIEIARAANIDFTPDESALQDDPGPAPANIAQEELIELYDKNIDPPYNGPTGRGPYGGSGGGGGGQLLGPAPFSYPPHASAPANMGGAFGGASYQPPQMTTLPPYSATDPNQLPVSSYVIPPPDDEMEKQAPPLPSKNPAGFTEKQNLDDDPGVTPQFPPAGAATPFNGSNLRQPPVAAPRSASPGIPDLPSVPSSFNASAKPSKPDPKDGGNEVDFDDLTRRFENLKNKK